MMLTIIVLLSVKVIEIINRILIFLSYCFNGVNLYLSRHNGKSCQANSGTWLTESAPIFRFYDGYASLPLDTKIILPTAKRAMNLI